MDLPLYTFFDFVFFLAHTIPGRGAERNSWGGETVWKVSIYYLHLLLETDC